MHGLLATSFTELQLSFVFWYLHTSLHSLGRSVANVLFTPVESCIVQWLELPPEYFWAMGDEQRAAVINPSRIINASLGIGTA
jgi:hypothetical protein